MVAYKKISPSRTDADFSKLERRDLLQSKNQTLTSTYFFMDHILFTIIFTGLFCSLLSDNQGAAADFDISITDCDIDNNSERKKC